VPASVESASSEACALACLITANLVTIGVHQVSPSPAMASVTDGGGADLPGLIELLAGVEAGHAGVELVAQVPHRDRERAVWGLVIGIILESVLLGVVDLRFGEGESDGRLERGACDGRHRGGSLGGLV